MSGEKHPFDVAAEHLEALSNKPTAGSEASPDFWELGPAIDDMGDYPQALSEDPPNRGPSDGLGPDGFPSAGGGLPELELQPDALWTDVLSSSLWSEGYLLNDRALAAFRRCNLGEHREYAVIVRDAGGQKRSYTYLFVRNLVPPASLDFGRSEFYITTALGIPQAPIAADSFEDFIEKRRKAREGELEGVKRFSSLDYKVLHLRPGQGPSADLFKLEQMGTRTYVTARLRAAIAESGISGLEVRPNKRLFA